MTAETGDGASGWAYGSQMWNGKIPAFVPNPSRANPNVAERIAGSEMGTAGEPVEGERARRLHEEQERQEDAARPDVRRDQVDEPRLPRLPLLVVEDDEEVGSEAHRLPAEQERQHVPRGYDEGHGEQEQIQEQRRGLPPPVRVEFLHVPDGVHGDEEPDEEDQDEEKRGEPVEEQFRGRPRHGGRKRDAHRGFPHRPDQRDDQAEEGGDGAPPEADDARAAGVPDQERKDAGDEEGGSEYVRQRRRHRGRLHIIGSLEVDGPGALKRRSRSYQGRNVTGDPGEGQA